MNPPQNIHVYGSMPKLESAQEFLLYPAKKECKGAKKVTPAMVDGPPPDISKIPRPKNRDGGATAKKGNGAKKCVNAGLILGQDVHGCNIYTKNLTDGNRARVSFLHKLAVFNAQPGINKMSVELGQLPWGEGIKKLAFPAAYINEIMTTLPRVTKKRQITSVESFRKWLTNVGYDLSSYKEDSPWFYLQFSPAIWNSPGCSGLKGSPTKMGSGVKRTMDQTDNSKVKTGKAGGDPQATPQKGQRKRTASAAVPSSSKKPKTVLPESDVATVIPPPLPCSMGLLESMGLAFDDSVGVLSFERPAPPPPPIWEEDVYGIRCINVTRYVTL
jgi:hypothetical protein